MATSQVVATSVSLSTGTILLLAGITLVGTLIYVNIKKKKKVISITNLSTNEEKYKNHRWIVENAIEKKDKDKVERLRDNLNIMKYEDLAKLINDFLDKDDYKNEKLK